MFSFLKNWFQKDNQSMRSLDELKQDIQEQTIVDMGADEDSASDMAAGPSGQPDQAVPMVKTDLSLHPGWEEVLDSEKKYTLRFLQAELPEMQDGTVGVTGFSLRPDGEGVTVAMFFRNGTKQPITFHENVLAVMFDDKLFARQEFDLSEMGEIPPYSSRPWEVFFPKSSFQMDNFAFTRWSVAMQINKNKLVWPKQLELDPKMEARMTEDQKRFLQLLVRKLPGLRPDQVEVTGYEIAKTDDGRLVVGLLFRNGLSVPFRPKKLRVRILDRQKELVAAGVLDASSIEVKPGTSRPWLVVFPAEFVKNPDADLSRWMVKVSE